MADYRSMFDRDYLGHWDLEGRDVTVTIREVKAGTLTSQGNRKSKKPIVYFQGKEKGLALNKTNGKIVAQLYGNDTEQWAGQRITLYATKTQFGSETVDCIRVRPHVPRDKSQGRPNGRSQAAAPQQPQEPGPDEADAPPPDDHTPSDVREPGSDG